MIFLAGKGMNLIQLGILEGLFHVTSFIMETPTGAIADIFGRKTSRILGRIFILLEMFLMLFGTSFAHFTAAFVLCAIGWNLESGAGDALVYDSLLETKDEDRYMKVNGWIEVTYQSAQAIGLFIGGWIAIRSYEVLYSGQMLIIIVSIAVALFFKETIIGREHIKEKVSFLASIKNQYVGSFTIVKGNKRLVYLIIFLNALGLFSTTGFFYMQIYCKQNGVNEDLMGILLSVSCIFGALGGVAAQRIEKIVKERRLMIALPVVYMIVMWGMVSFKTAVFSFLLIGFLDSTLYVVYSDYINRLIPSEKRATLLSFSSMVFSFFMIMIFPAAGGIGEYLSLEYAFAFLAFFATVLAVINLYLFRPMAKMNSK